MADGCTAVLAASIADKAGSPSALFHRSATAHLDRLLTPALVFAVKGAFRSGPLREFPHKLQSIVEAQRSADISGHHPDSEYGGADDVLGGFFDPATPYAQNGLFSHNGDEHAREIDPAADEQRPARHRR